MWKPAATGSALFVAGAAKFAVHLNRVPTLEDYLAFRCGAPGSGKDVSALEHLLGSAGHCWGCYAMAAGAAIVAVAAWHWARNAARVARPRN
jgi:hypothetical protein